jgi:hypothetical protein
MDSVMAEPHLNAMQRQSFPLRIHAECHGGSGPERGKQVFIGPWSTIGAAK